MGLSFEKQNHWGCRHPGRGAIERPGRRTERGRVKQQCGVSGGAGRRQGADRQRAAATQTADNSGIEKDGKKHGESARLKNMGAQGVKRVGGKGGENAGAQGGETTAGVAARTKGAVRAICRTESGPDRLVRTWTERLPF